MATDEYNEIAKATLRLENKYNEARGEIARINGNLLQLRGIADKSARVDELEKQLAMERSEIVRYRKQRIELTEQTVASESLIKVLRETIVDLRRNLETYQDSAKEWHDNYDRAQIVIDRMTKSIDYMNEQEQERENLITKMRGELEQNQQALFHSDDLNQRERAMIMNSREGKSMVVTIPNNADDLEALQDRLGKLAMMHRKAAAAEAAEADVNQGMPRNRVLARKMGESDADYSNRCAEFKSKQNADERPSVAIADDAIGKEIEDKIVALFGGRFRIIRLIPETD